MKGTCLLVSEHSIPWWRSTGGKGQFGTCHEARNLLLFITEEMKVFIEEHLQRNDELTSTSIKRLLAERWSHAEVSTATIKCVRRKLGWVCTRPHYCQLLRDVWYCTYVACSYNPL